MKLAIYDFDGTYIDLQTLPFLFELWKVEKLNRKEYKKIWRKIMRRYLYHKLGLFGWDKPTFRANAMQLTIELFHTVDEVELKEFLQLFHDRLQEHIPNKIKELLAQDKAEGYLTVLLSGNYDIILEPFIQDGFNQVIGSISSIDGRLRKADEVSIIIENAKAEVIKQKYPEADFNASKAYADSSYDLPIFKLVGHPIAINPDEELLQIAQEEGFDIIKI